MRKNGWKNKLLVSIMVLVLIGTLFLPTAIGADTRANPNIKVTVAIDEPTDVMGNYGNLTHNFTVTIENTGKEQLSNVVVNVTVYNTTTNLPVHVFTGQVVASLGIDESTMLHFQNWDAGMEGDYYVMANATADAYPSSGVAVSVEDGITHTFTIADYMDLEATMAGFDGITHWYMEGTMRVFGVATYDVELTVTNVGNTYMSSIDVYVQIYKASDNSLQADLTDTITSIDAGDSATTVISNFNSAVDDTEYFFKFWVMSSGDMNPGNDLYNETFKILDLTDVMPVAITSHEHAMEYNTSAQTFKAMIKNSGTQDLAENFWVILMISQGATIWYVNETVDYTIMQSPGDEYEVVFTPIALTAGTYTVNVTTHYSLSGNDYNTTNNVTADITIQIGDTPGFSVEFNYPMEGKQEMTDVIVNVTVTNTGSIHSMDIGSVFVNLTIYDNNGTAGDQSDDVIVKTEAKLDIDLAPSAMEDFLFSAWTMMAEYNGTTFRVVVEVIEDANPDVVHASAEVEVEFPSNYGMAHFMITPEGPATAGATVSIAGQSAAVEDTTSSVWNEYLFNMVLPGSYTASVSGVYGYSDNSTGVTITREILSHVPMNMNAIAMHTLSGFVVDAKGMPVEGATVEVISTKVNAPSVVTNEYGYNFTVEPGTVTVKASKLGYTANQTDISVSADMDKNITITIIPAPVTVKVDTDTELGDTPTTGVAVDTAIDFYFDLGINLTTVTTNIKLMKKVDMSAVPGMWAFTTNNSMNFTFTPTSDLATDTAYVVMIMEMLKLNNSEGGGNWYYNMNKTFQFQTVAPGAFDVMGMVVDQDNDPVEGINVSVGTIWAFTGSDGKFTLEKVPAGVNLTVAAQDKEFYGYPQYDASGADAKNTTVTVKDGPVTLGKDLVVVEQDLPVEHKFVMAADDVNVTVGTTITLIFQEAMNVTSIKNNFDFTMEGQTNAVTGKWNVSNNNMTFVFTPDALLEQNKDYTMSLGKDIIGDDGDPVFWDNLEVMVHTEVIPTKITASIMVNNAAITSDKYALSSTISIQFNLVMNKTATQGAISVMEGTNAQVVTYTWDAAGKVVTLGVTLECGKTYKVTVGKAVKDLLGTALPLSADVTGSFTTIDCEQPTYSVTLYIEGDGDVELYKGDKMVASGSISNDQVTLTIAAEDYTPGTYTVKVKGKGDYKDDEWDITLNSDGTWSGPGTSASNPRELEKEEEGGNMMLIIIIVIVVIIIIVVLVMMAMRKKPEEEEVVEEGEAAEEAGEFECPACGALVSSEEKVCPECGEEFEEEEFKCPECGAPIEADATTCEACGAEFELEEDIIEGEEGEEGEEEDYEVEEDEEELGEDEDFGEGEEGEEDEELEEVEEDEFEEEDDELAGEEDELDDLGEDEDLEEEDDTI